MSHEPVSTIDPEEQPPPLARIDTIQFERENYYKSCCLYCDKRALQFFSVLIISVSVMIFCMIQIHIVPKCDEGEYIGLLTFILGVLLPSPAIKR